MIKYLALLRGINVGGNNIIRMSELKSCFEAMGFENVITFIQSGNVIFESPETNLEKLTKKIEKALSSKFNYKSKIVLRTYDQLKRIVEQAPKSWGRDPEYKHNLLFIKEPMTAEKALIECGEPRKKFETATVGEGVIYLSASIANIGKTTFVKLAGKPIYQQITVRNYNTSVKLLKLMKY
jgi:uncharacterized protein (DUF1697 family)